MDRHFRLVSTWCCKTQFEWLGKELPNFCPQCGWAFKPNKIIDVLFDTLINGSNAEIVLETAANKGK